MDRRHRRCRCVLGRPGDFSDPFGGAPVEAGGRTGSLASVADDPLTRVRAFCLALPETTERTSHGSPAFFCGKQFVMLWHHGHHDHDFPHLWCAAPPGAQPALTRDRPDRFFVPPYVGHRGWLGVRLDGTVDWAEVEDLCEDAYRCVAPKRLLALLAE